MGTYGIALAREDAGKFDEAATLYGQIIANADFDNTCVVVLAKDKLEALTAARQSFAFVEPAAEPVVETTEEVETEEAVN
jgi:hypothetical protein